MKAVITALSPGGYPVEFHTDEQDWLISALLDNTGELGQAIAKAGYLPSGELPRSPEGLPICPKHGQPMRKREKQGDTWYSHNVVHPETGEILYCKGRPGNDSPGWDVANNPPQPPAPSPSSPQRGELEGGEPHPPPSAQIDNSPTAFWTLATRLIEEGKITHPHAGDIAKGPGTWTEKAARLALA